MCLPLYSVACTAGQFTSTQGSLGCKGCPSEYGSSTQANSCDLASVGHFLVPVRSGKRGSEGDSGGSPNVTAPCPAHSVCAGGRQAPVPDKGFWVDRCRYAYAAELYVCTRSTCIVGQAINASCFAGDKAYPDYDDRKGVTAISGCADPPEGTSLLCSEGARGYLW